MNDVAILITGTVELLWSLALALLVAEVYFIARFFANRSKVINRTSTIFMAISIIFLSVSMVFGYLTYSSAIMMALPDLTDVEAFVRFDDATFSAMAQVICFCSGLVVFLISFFTNLRTFGRELKNE